MSARWKLGRFSFWADKVTLVGGDPIRTVRLTERGAERVREILSGLRQQHSSAESTLLQRLQRGNLITQHQDAPPAATTHDVTLVIPALAAAADVQRVLDSAPRTPAIVVDDGSPTPLADHLAHSASLHVVRHDVPQGPAAARNRGAREASTQWVAFADSDVIADTGWIGHLLDVSAPIGGCVAIAPRIRSRHGSGLAAQFERHVCALDMGEHAGFVHPTGELSYVPSAALLVRRDTFLAEQGFNETMQVGEDVDLIWRLAAAGVYYEPSVVIHHEPRPTLVAALRRRAQYGYSAGALGAQHPDLMHHGSFPIATALPWILGILAKPSLATAASIGGLALSPRALSDLPPSAAIRLTAYGQYRSAAALSRVMGRPLLPATLLLSLLNRRSGRRAAAAWAVGSLLKARGNPVTAAWMLLDDAAYAAGVWRAAIERRRPGLLAPRFKLGRRRG